jgi:hypothetical protein
VVSCKKGLTASGQEELAVFLVAKWCSRETEH